MTADMSKSVFRYIAEEAWRTEGRLGILVRLITILPLQYSYRFSPSDATHRADEHNFRPAGRDRSRCRSASIDRRRRCDTWSVSLAWAGSSLDKSEPDRNLMRCGQTISPPTLRVQVYHPEERLYTILMVDPGVYQYLPSSLQKLNDT